jgi:hypothetical protein
MLRSSFRSATLFLIFAMAVLPLRGDSVPESKERLREGIKYLASDDLEGRGVGTNGLNVAAEFIKNEFAKAGLAINRVDGGAFQKFDLVTGSKLVEPNSLQLTGPDGTTIDLKVGTDVEVCSFGGSGTFNADVVFCGYGIDSSDDPHAGVSGAPKEESFHYNDFEELMSKVRS